MNKKTKSESVSASPQTSERKEDVGLETPTALGQQDARRQAMSPEAQRIAIAEACGWKRGQVEDYSFADPTKKRYRESWIDRRGIDFRKLPDYLSDLNAMHEAEKVLTEDQKFDYNDILDDLEPDKWVWERTAAQRAEAFLRTLNLWKPDPSPDFQKHQG